jgi:hypothetical protein
MRVYGPEREEFYITEENCIMRNFVIFRSPQISL